MALSIYPIIRDATGWILDMETRQMGMGVALGS